MRKFACKTLSFILLFFASVMLLPTTTYAAPDPLLCDQATEIGQQRFDAATNEFYVCRDSLIGWESFNSIGPAAGGGGGFVDGQINWGDCQGRRAYPIGCTGLSSNSYNTSTASCSADYVITAMTCSASSPGQYCSPDNLGKSLIARCNGIRVASVAASITCCRYKNHP